MLLQISNSEFNSEFNHLSPCSQSAHPNMKEGSIAWRADQENTVSMLIFHIWEQVLGRHLLGVNYLQFDWSGWIVLI